MKQKVYLKEGLQLYDEEGNLWEIEDGDYTVINDRIMQGPILNTDLLKSIEDQDKLDTILDLIDEYGESYILNQLLTGQSIEMEHTDDIYVAFNIAVDHICEIYNYYTGLIAMEQDLKDRNNQ